MSERQRGRAMSEYQDVRYEVEGPTAIVTIDRPERYNSFRGRTVEELISAFRAAGRTAACRW